MDEALRQGARWRGPGWAAWLLVVLLAWTPAGTSWAAPGSTLVLAAGPHFPEGVRLSPQEVRLLFLGGRVSRGGVRLQPVLNAADPFLEEVFLQKVLFMSKAHYQRRLVALAFRLGRPRPPVFQDEEALAEHLRRRPGAVSYLWARHARRLGLTIVQELWSDSAP